MRFSRASTWLLLTVTAGAISAQPPQVVRDSIPGTRVALTFVHVAGGSVELSGRSEQVQPFLIGQTEVTWDAYDAFTLARAPSARYAPAGADAQAGPSRPYGNPDYGFGHAGFPVISVTREAAIAFCVWLTRVTGHRYRLPTEAEWQQAATLAAPGSTGVSGWHAGNAATRTHAVATLAPDALGLHDLFGNAAEWVTTSDGARVVRGGSWRDRAEDVGPHARAVQRESWTERDPQIPGSNWWLSDGPFVGFRIVREL